MDVLRQSIPIFYCNFLENRIAKGKLKVWLAIEEGVFSVESYT